MALLAAGVLFAAYSLETDIVASGMPVKTWLPSLLLGVGLLIALGFEFVNGVHDTANAVATGLDDPSQLRPEHFMRRAVPDRIVTFADLYRVLEPGELLAGTEHPRSGGLETGAPTASTQPARR